MDGWGMQQKSVILGGANSERSKLPGRRYFRKAIRGPPVQVQSHSASDRGRVRGTGGGDPQEERETMRREEWGFINDTEQLTANTNLVRFWPNQYAWNVFFVWLVVVCRITWSGII